MKLITNLTFGAMAATLPLEIPLHAGLECATSRVRLVRAGGRIAGLEDRLETVRDNNAAAPTRLTPRQP